MLFADAEILTWVQAIREFGGLAVLAFLVWQLQPALKMFLEYQSSQAALDRTARDKATEAYQVSIAEAYRTMRDEGNKNREAQERSTERVVEAIGQSCMWSKAPGAVPP